MLTGFTCDHHKGSCGKTGAGFGELLHNLFLNYYYLQDFFFKKPKGNLVKNKTKHEFLLWNSS